MAMPLNHHAASSPVGPGVLLDTSLGWIRRSETAGKHLPGGTSMHRRDWFKSAALWTAASPHTGGLFAGPRESRSTNRWQLGSRSKTIRHSI